MKDEKIQLPLREDENFKNTLNNLFDYYKKKISFLLPNDVKEIDYICKTLIDIIDADEIIAYRIFDKLMEKSLKKRLHIIEDDIPIDGYGKTRSNLFRIRRVKENKNYKRKDIFHEPKDLFTDRERKSYRYNLTSRPSLYLGTTVYSCCSEINCLNDYNSVIGSLYRVSPHHRDLYIINLGCRPIDFNKNIKSKKPYSFTQYLFVYPLIAACSVIAATKDCFNIPEYKISRMLYQWLIDHYSEKLCGIRYFSCYDAYYKILDKDNHLILEKDSNYSFTKYFINYAFPISDNIDSNGYCKKLKKDFIVSVPRFIRDQENIKEFEINLKKVLRLKSIDE